MVQTPFIHEHILAFGKNDSQTIYSDYVISVNSSELTTFDTTPLYRAW